MLPRLEVAYYAPAPGQHPAVTVRGFYIIEVDRRTERLASEAFASCAEAERELARRLGVA